MLMNKVEADPLHDLVYLIIRALGGEATLVGAVFVEKEIGMGWGERERERGVPFKGETMREGGGLEIEGLLLLCHA
jgi:hypothetical protein